MGSMHHPAGTGKYAARRNDECAASDHIHQHADQPSARDRHQCAGHTDQHNRDQPHLLDDQPRVDEPKFLLPGNECAAVLPSATKEAVVAPVLGLAVLKYGRWNICETPKAEGVEKTVKISVNEWLNLLVYNLVSF